MTKTKYTYETEENIPVEEMKLAGFTLSDKARARAELHKTLQKLAGDINITYPDDMSRAEATKFMQAACSGYVPEIPEEPDKHAELTETIKQNATITPQHVAEARKALAATQELLSAPAAAYSTLVHAHKLAKDKPAVTKTQRRRRRGA